MTIFLNKLDPAPLQSEQFSFYFEIWLSNTVSQLNEALEQIQVDLNAASGFELPVLTEAEIVALSPGAEDGTMWYCSNSSPPNVVVKINGALRQMTNTAFP